MKVPLKWLRDYVDLTLTEPQLVERLTLAGLEVAGVRVLGLPIPEGLRVKAEDRGPVWARDKVMTAKVTRVDPHPDADRLKLPTVEYGPGLVKQLVTGAPNLSVGQSNPKLSARYAAVLLKNVKVRPAPGWMQRRLLYAGMRPINNIVDITNYVMLEWGQPLHAFDFDKLLGRAAGKPRTIIVRPARAGETLVTLDNQKRELTPDMLVIADTAGPIALAGVMGGAETEVTEKTTKILLESANFDFLSIRRTMKALNLPSEASIRFSKGIHPETVRPAAERAAELMRQHAGATIGRGLVDCYPAPPAPQTITLTMA